MTVEFTGKTRLPAATLHSERPAQPSGGTASSTQTTAPPGDTLTVTDQASDLRGLQARLNNEPVVDMQRVENLRYELARGQYEPDMARVAEKFFRFEFSLRS
jgi:negative regulator of flagellin synthesis FlgM